MSREDFSPVKLAMDWLKGQPFQNVMSVLLLAVVSALGYCAIYDLIPAERQAIQHMIESIEHQHTEQVNRISQSFDKALDRWSDRDRKYGTAAGKPGPFPEHGHGVISSREE